MKQCPKCKRYLCGGTCNKFTYTAETEDDYYGDGEMYGTTHADIAERIAMEWNSEYDHMDDEIFITISDGEETIKFSVIPEQSVDYHINEIQNK